MRTFYLDFLKFEMTIQIRFKPKLPLYLGAKYGDCLLHVPEHFYDRRPGLR